MTTIRLRWLAVLTAALFAWLAQAPSARATPSCVANASNIAFGTLGVNALTGATTTGTIYEGCTGGFLTLGNLAVCNAIGLGGNSGSSRTMKYGGNSISYNLYSDSMMQVPYATPGSNSFYIPYSASAGGYTTTTTYAKILSSALGLPPGTYTDSYSTNGQGWASFNSIAITLPIVICGFNTINLGQIPTFTVSVTVLPSCAVSVGAMSFSSVSTLTANVDATATLTVTCVTSVPYTVALGPGAATGATTTTRAMTGSGGAISYALYSDAGRTQNWGNNPPPSASADTVSGVGVGSAQMLTVYGRVPPQRTPTQGGYSDTVLVSVTY